MLKIRLFLLACFSSFILCAQDAVRYEMFVFDSISIQEDLAYAKYKPSFWKGLFSSKDSTKLIFDFYDGAADGLEQRPLVILAHGGAFVKGSHKDKHITILAENLAKRGYAVASISYRLREYPSLLKLGYLGVQDARAAIRYFRSNAKRFKIHPDYIFFGGVSAGGVMALHTAYLDDGEAMAGRDFETRFGCLDCFGDYRDTPSEVKGIINIAGALIDTTCIRKDDQVPSIHFHGTDDNILGYDKDLPLGSFMEAYNGIVDTVVDEIKEEKSGVWGDFLESFVGGAKMPEVFGAKAIARQLSQKDIPHDLITFSKDNHYLMVDEKGEALPTFKTIEEKSSQFILELIRPKKAPINVSTTATINHISSYETTTITEGYHWEVEGGTIISKRQNTIKIQWNKLGKGKVSLQVTNELGARSEATILEVDVLKETSVQRFWRGFKTVFPWGLALILAIVLLAFVFKRINK